MKRVNDLSELLAYIIYASVSTLQLLLRLALNVSESTKMYLAKGEYHQSDRIGLLVRLGKS